MLWRCTATSNPASVASSRNSSLRSSGLSTSAMTGLLHDLVARLHDVVNGACRRREQRRAHGRNDRALRSDIANERAASDFGDAHALARHRDFRSDPAANERSTITISSSSAAGAGADHL